ncbi:MAG TPA: hypothetical protein VL993_07135 [Stellaceae bacterium]|nr:hypothetical protein [Stellaceae bacterium]
MARDVHLVGSVPMADAAEVFERVSAALGTRLPRLPDGETGERIDWILWLEKVFRESPAFELSDEVFKLHATAPTFRRYGLKPGRSVGEARFDNLYYADIARQSYAVFARMRAAGKIPAGARYQVDLVPAHSVLWLFMAESLQDALDPLYNEALAREIDKLAAAIPAADLAIQFDVASAVFARLQRGDYQPYGTTRGEAMERFVAILGTLGNRVPKGVELLFHFCYGDSNHRHVVEPKDMADMVEMANRLTRSIARPIDLIHMPVPRDRSDEAYFAPLKGLRDGTKLSLGLVHHTDGFEGTKRRFLTARRFVEDFSVATECGFGRRRPETIPELLKIHADIADLD